MALVVKDRVQEVTTTTGTGTITLGGAALGFQSFATIGNGNTTYYTINDPLTGDWEVGIGTYTSAGPSLSRDTVFSSSNAGALVPFVSGSKNVFVTYPSERAVYLDQPGSYPVQNTFNTLTAGTATLTAGTVNHVPASGTDIANKAYVDTTATGLHIHPPVYVATNVNTSTVYANGGTTPTWTTITSTSEIATGSAHGLSVNAVIVFGSTTNGLTAGYGYFVKSTPTTTSITVSLLKDGPTIITLTNGTGLSITSRANAGVGATLTASVNGTLTVIDGAAITVGNRILVGNNTNQYENGIYDVTSVGSGSTKWVLTRSSDANTYDPRSDTALGEGDYFFIQAGNTSKGDSYVLGTQGTIIFGTTNLVFSQFSESNVYSAGTGLSLSSLTFSITNTGTAGTYGGAASVPVFTTNAQGQVTTVTPTAIAIASGAVSGLAASATTDTTNASNISSGTLGTARLTGSYTGITGTGALAAGSLATGFTAVSAPLGGTGQTSYAVGDLLYADTTTSLAKLADVAVGNALISGGVGSAPSWGKIGLATHVSGTLPVANGGTGVTSSTGTGSVVLSTSPTLVTPLLGTPTSGNFSTGTFTWPTFNQNTTGSAGSAANLTGGTISGNYTVNNATSPNTYYLLFGDNTGWTYRFMTSVSGTPTTRFSFTDQGAFNAVGAITQNGSQVLTAGNYNSYAPTLTGTGASGTWSINVTGSAGSTSSVAGTTATAIQSAYQTAINTTTPGLGTYGIHFNGQTTSDYASGITWNGGTTTTQAQAGIYVQGSGAYGTKMYLATTDSYATGSKTALSIDSSGTVLTTRSYLQAAGSLRAPIFYDSDNTAYYLDPNSTSNIFDLQITGASNKYLYINPGNGYEAMVRYNGGSGSGWYVGKRSSTDLVGSESFHFYSEAAVRTVAGVDTGGNIFAYSSMRAPIFYDNNNTAYYGDFASTSILNGVLTSSAVSDNNSGLRNVLPGGGSYVSTASTVTGAIQITLPTTNYPMVRFTVKVYTYDGLSFEISCGGHTSSSVWYNTFAYMTTQNRSALNVRFCYGGGQTFVYIGELGSTWSYPQVFITDVQVGYSTYSASQWNTGWVVAFNSSTYNSVSSTHTVYPPTSSGNNTNPAYASIFYDSNNTAYYVDPDNTSSMWNVNIRGDLSSTNTGNQIFFWGSGSSTTSAIGFKANGGNFSNPTGTGDGYNTYLTMDTAGRGWVFRQGTGGTDFTSLYNSGWILNNGIWQANASMRAPIFYDSNDTTYYLDPNSQSFIYYLSTNVGQEAPGAANSSSIGMVLRGNYNSNTWAHKFHKYDNGNGVPLYLSYTPGAGSWVASQGWGPGLTYTSQVFGSFGADTSVYSPIFYDSNNTGYYGDFASTSNFNRLNLVGFTSSGRNYSYEWIELPNYTGIYSPNNGAHFYPNNQSSYTPWIVQGSRNTWRGLHFYDGGNTPHLMFDGSANGGVYYEAGGRWASYYAYSNNCWGFGTSTTSSAYNIYCNTGIYSGGRVDGTIFYDTNNTGYYLDPAGTSNLSSATFTSGGQCVTAYGNGSVNGSAGIGLNVYSTGGNGAIMAFHRAGYYAVNMGLDSDNVLRIGGWSAAASRWQLDMSGNNYVAGDFYAGNNVRIGKGNNFVATNTAVGVSALASVNSNYHTAVGYNALQAHTTYVNPVFPIAGGSTAVGYGALQANYGNATLGAGNTAIGSGAMYTSTGGYLCTVVGAYAAYNMGSASGNTVIGHSAGITLYTNSNSVIIGYYAAQNYNSNAGYGSGNTSVVIGNYAGGMSAGSNNVIIGNNASSDSYGAIFSGNTLIGASALNIQTFNATNCTFVGRSSMSAWDGVNISNSSTLGYNTAVTGDNQVQIGNSSTTTYVYGTVQNRSDARDKADIRDTQLGLDFIEALRPVDFRWDYRDSYIDHILSEDEDGNDTSTFVENPQDGSRKRTRYHHGLIAQEVKEMLDAKGIDFGGYQDHSVAGGKDVLTIGYDELVGPLIKAVQELSSQVKALSLELADLKAKS